MIFYNEGLKLCLLMGKDIPGLQKKTFYEESVQHAPGHVEMHLQDFRNGGLTTR